MKPDDIVKWDDDLGHLCWGFVVALQPGWVRVEAQPDYWGQPTVLLWLEVSELTVVGRR